MKTVSTDELAELMGTHPWQVRDWMKAGCPVHKRGTGGRGKDGANQFVLKDVVGWLKDRALKAALKSSDHEIVSSEEAKRRKLAAEAALQEIELAKAKELVIDVQAVEQDLSNRFAELRSNIRKIPERVAIRLVAENDETEIKKVLLEEIDAVLEVLTSHAAFKEERDISQGLF